MDGPSPTRRSVVAGAAWAVPIVMYATAAPVFAASPWECLRLRHLVTNRLGCPLVAADIYYRLAINSSCPTFVTTENLVIDIEISNPDRTRSGLSVNTGSLETLASNGSSPTKIRWTIAKGRTITPSTEFTFEWHFWLDIGFSTHVTASIVGGTSHFSSLQANPTSSASGYTLTLTGASCSGDF